MLGGSSLLVLAEEHKIGDAKSIRCEICVPESIYALSFEATLVEADGTSVQVMYTTLHRSSHDIVILEGIPLT